MELKYACRSTCAVLCCALSLSRVRLFVTLQTVALQALLSMGFSRQEHWSGLPRPPPGELPDPGIKPVSLGSPALAGGFLYHWCHLGSPGPLVTTCSRENPRLPYNKESCSASQLTLGTTLSQQVVFPSFLSVFPFLKKIEI